MKHILCGLVLSTCFFVYAQDYYQYSDMYLSTTGNYHSSDYSAFIDSQNAMYDVYESYSPDSLSPTSYTTPDYTTSTSSRKRPAGLFADVVDKYVGGTIPHNTLATATMFNPSSATPIAPTKLAAQFSTNPLQQQSYTDLAYNVLTVYDTILASTNTPKYDLATALAFSLQNSYRVLTGSEPTSGQYQGVLEVMRTLILESDVYQQATDAQKQEVYETFIIMGLGVASLYDNALQEGNTELAKQLQETAYRYVESILGPLERWQLTDTDLILVY